MLIFSGQFFHHLFYGFHLNLPYFIVLSYQLLDYSIRSKMPDLKSLNKIDRNQKTAVLETLEKDYPFIKTSSAGRLFDGVSGLLGLCRRQTYDAETPIRLQNAAEKAEPLLPKLKPYTFILNDSLDSRLLAWAAKPGPDRLSAGMTTVDWRPIIREITEELETEKSTEIIAARFHLTVAEIIKSVCLKLSGKSKIDKVILAGGVFQNQLLLKLTREKLAAAGFFIFVPEKLPINDAGICLGQLLIAKESLRTR